MFKKITHGVSMKWFFKDLKKEIADDNVTNGAAALAYYLTLAIFPAMIAFITILPYLPIRDLDKALMDLLNQAMPQQAAATLSDVVKEVTTNKKSGLLSFGLLATLWAASSGMTAIMQALNITYDVKEERSFLKVRARALGLTVMFGFLIVTAFSLVVFGGIIQSWLSESIGSSGMVLTAFAAFRWAIIIAAIMLGFALVYYLAPNVDQKFKFVSPGAVLGTALLALASLAFKFYVSNFGKYDATYGSIGAVIILMLWLYVMGLVLLLGSEVNALIEHYSPQGKNKGEKQLAA